MRPASKLRWALVALAVAGAGREAAAAAEAAGACVHRPAPAGTKGKRVAIVVGNAAYGNGIPVLANPVNDAEATAKALGPLGFEVFLSTDATSGALRQCLDKAYASLGDADVAALYYSGHGIQIKDENYLVATDAGTGDLTHGFVPVQPIVDALQKQAKATLVFLDACRNNPLAEQGHAGLSTSTGRGLGRVKDTAVASTPAVVQARGLMVAYSTSPNAVARDGTGRLSPFTGAFVKAVGNSGYSIQHVMSDVTRAVGDETDWAQTPWMKSSLTNELKLGGGQTLAEAKSASDNFAARSANLLDTDGRQVPAIIEALKGLPAEPSEATLKRFPKAYFALYSAVQSREIVLPLSPGMTEVAVSTQNRAAVYKLSADYQSGTFQLWSVSDQKVVATPEVGRGGASEKFTFSPHGNLLAVVSRGSTGVFNGLDGTKLFELRGRASSVEFSPDETRLLLADSNEKLTIVDVATHKPTTTIKLAQLVVGPHKRGSEFLTRVVFGGNDKVCFALNQGGGDNGETGVVGVFDLKDNRTTRSRGVDNSSSIMLCDPAGRYMVRTLGSRKQGMEIWDLTNDKVTDVDAPIVNLMGIDPKGNYVSALSSDNAAQGFYNLATAKRDYPPTVPDGYWILGSRVRNPSGGLVSQDVSNNPWRDWPDETLYGPALVKHALAGLTAAQRAEVDRDRITYAVVADNP